MVLALGPPLYPAVIHPPLPATPVAAITPENTLPPNQNR
jgi:hypothetical protein